MVLPRRAARTSQPETGRTVAGLGRGATAPGGTAGRGRPARLRSGWLLAGVATVLAAAVAGLAIGPVALNPFGVAAEVVGLLPGVHIDSGLSPQERSEEHTSE